MPQDTNKRDDHRTGSAAEIWQRAARVRWLAASIDDEVVARKLVEFADELHARAMTKNVLDTMH
jgi:hypothetical protein